MKPMSEAYLKITALFLVCLLAALLPVGADEPASVIPDSFQPPFTPEKLGSPIKFDGNANNANLGNPADQHLDLGTNATIETWVRFDALPNRSFATFVGKDEGGGNTNKWIFGYACGYGGIANAIMFHINLPSSGPIWLQSDSWIPNVGRWYHLAVVKKKDDYTFYRDGIVDGTDSATRAAPVVNANLFLGQAEGGFRLQGALDDTRIWNVRRTTQEIQSNMKNELTGSESGLVGYWKFDERRGKILDLATAYGGGQAQVSGNTTDKLKTLKQAYDQGLITKEVYDQKVKEVLDGM